MLVSEVDSERGAVRDEASGGGHLEEGGVREPSEVRPVEDAVRRVVPSTVDDGEDLRRPLLFFSTRKGASCFASTRGCLTNSLQKRMFGTETQAPRRGRAS